MRIRPEIAKFTEAMEYKMADKDAERGCSWKEEDFDFFISRLETELCEVKEAYNRYKQAQIDDIRSTVNLNMLSLEAADVGNFAMMLYWKCLERSNMHSYKLAQENMSRGTRTVMVGDKKITITIEDM